MKDLEDFLCPTQKQLFKRLCKKFKGKTLISNGNFILVRGQAPVKDIYEFLLDFYSAKELESFRTEFGDQILWQIYNDEVAPFYYF